jgi:hypothetical protein
LASLLQQQQEQKGSVPHQHFSRAASYKGTHSSASTSTNNECKRLMAKDYMESVAERAAHFEPDIDMERYNKLKAKFYELDLAQQQQSYYTSNLYLLNSFVESLMSSPSLATKAKHASAPSTSTRRHQPQMQPVNNYYDPKKLNNTNSSSSSNTPYDYAAGKIF